MSTPGKIFGIGLSRTGTKSLSQALALLGYRTAHFVEHLKEQRGATTWFAGNFQADCLTPYDAALDLPIPTFFAQLYLRYPGSKFILTLRERSSWLASVRRHWQEWPDGNDDYRRLVRVGTYGMHGFCELRFTHVYVAHVRNILWHFRRRRGDLLVMNICAGDGWDELCPFLGKPGPGVPFPWAHRSRDADRSPDSLLADRVGPDAKSF